MIQKIRIIWKTAFMNLMIKKKKANILNKKIFKINKMVKILIIINLMDQKKKIKKISKNKIFLKIIIMSNKYKN